MASFRKRGGSWEASVVRHGIRKTATFDTKAEASAWATAIEAEILAGKRGDVPNKTFGELLDRYLVDVSANKRGEKWEKARIGLTQRDNVAKVKLVDLSAVHVSE